MRPAVVLILLVTSEFSASSSLTNDVGIRRNVGQDGEFIDSMGNWFKHVRDRIHERFFGATAPPPPAIQPEVDTIELARCLNNRPKFFVNVSELSFDPVEDWGFRIGRWYFIRKLSDDQYTTGRPFTSDPVLLTTRATTTTTTTTEKPFESTSNDPEMTQGATDVTQPETEPTTDQTEIDLSGEGGLETGEEGVAGNEIDEPVGKGSVEIFMKR